MIIILVICFCIGFCVSLFKAFNSSSGNTIVNNLHDISPNNNDTIEDEITQLEILIERRKEIARIVEDELQRTTNEKRKAVLLSRLNTLDSQTFRDFQKINKLLEK